MAYQYVRDELCLVQNKKEIAVKQLKLTGPTYVYDLNDILLRLEKFQKSFSSRVHIHYAMKANSNFKILQALQKKNIGIDAVSFGEVKRSLEIGFAPEKIVLSGVSKTHTEIQQSLQAAIGQFNVESPQELVRIGQIAKTLGKIAPVAFRMNPDVDPQTHPYIKTGFRENKFGMDLSFLPELIGILKANSESLNLVGVTIHIGSQLLETEAIHDAIQKSKTWISQLRGQGFNLQVFDIGGGLGIQYNNSNYESEFALLEKYGAMVDKEFKGLDLEIHCEPGRFFVGHSGLLVTEVQYIKSSPHKNFAMVDTGMHHLLRPALYQAFHRILPLKQKSGSAKAYDIVGPICESSDVLGRDRLFSNLEQGDLLAVMDTGAYGFCMANQYNLHAEPAEVVLYNGEII